MNEVADTSVRFEGPGGQGFVNMKLECNGSDLY